MEEKKGKILVVYFHNLGYPLRKTNEQMLYCFERFSDHVVFFLNLAFPVPRYILKISFDLVIFHDLLLCKRSLPRRFHSIRRRAQPLKKVSGYRIATVQDEFIQTDLLNEFLQEFEVKHIFSVAPPSEWPKIYPALDPARVKFDFCLTGYIDDEQIARIERLSQSGLPRTIDIGYRATPIQHSLGFIGYLKVRITEVFRDATKNTPLKVNISNDPKDAFLGDEWYRFLLSCKYTLGVESGASVLDHDGSVDRRVQEYLSKNPSAQFEEVRNACFADRDGELKLQVMGPRHLEASLTRTCQILTEGEYNGILRPYEHYIPVKKDFSNISEVLRIIQQDEQRESIIESAYQEMVVSGKYSLKSYVSNLLIRSLGTNPTWSTLSTNEQNTYRRNASREGLIWRYVKIRTILVNRILRWMPTELFKQLERYMKK